MPIRLSQFWQELKRRNVVRIITVYAGAAFVIIELINNITEPLRLPEWTPTLVIVLLAIGFPIVIIFSWIYDVHPDGGLVKTEPAHKVKPEGTPTASNGWRIASYISFVVIVGLIVLNIIPRARGERISEILDKSIAVLPFKNDSPDEEKMYFINGTMDAILDNLSKIAELRVVSRNSVEQYRDNPKPTPVVAEEMDVSYVLEGSGQKIGNRVLLIVQLIDGKNDHHLWSKQYDREIEKVEDLIDIQKEIAQLVAEAIEAVITPEEKELIEKVPTPNLSAYDFYQMGMEVGENGDINRAKELFLEALNYDSTFGMAYCGLATYYIQKIYNNQEDFSGNYGDSVLYFTNVALSYDDQLYDAYTLRAYYYYQTGKSNLALQDLERAIELNPNDAFAYTLKSQIYYASDLLEDLKATHKSVSIDKTPGLNYRLGRLASSFGYAGFFDKSNYYYAEKLKLDDDSSSYYNSIAFNDYWQGDFNTSIELYKKSIAIDSTAAGPRIYLARSLCEIGQYEESLGHLVKYIGLTEGEVNDFTLSNFHRIAYIFSQNGLEEEAEYYLNQAIEMYEAAINSSLPWAQKKYTYYDLAGVYALKGEKDKAYENLRTFNQIERAPYLLNALMKRDPLFNSIRDEPEFQQIVRDVEAKYQAEHERVRQWLVENGML